MSIGRTTSIGFASDASIFLLGVVVSVVLRRSLGPELSGIYVILVTANLVLASLAHLSLGTAFTTFVARGRYLASEMHTMALLFSLVMGAVTFLVISFAFPLLQGNVLRNVPFSYLSVSLVLVPTTIYQLYWTSVMLGLNRFVLVSKLNLTLNIWNALFMVLVVGVLRAGIPGFLMVWSSSALVGTAFALALAARVARPQWPPNLGAVREVLRFGTRSHGANVAHQLFLRFDLFAVNLIVGTTGVGFYSLSTSLAEKLWLPLNSINASSIAKIAQLPREESALLTAKVSRTGVLAMLTMALPLAVISPWIIPFLYGPDFAASVLPLVILLVGTLSFAVMMTLNNYILGQMERPGLLSIISWLELGISVPLYIGLIVTMGIVGAALASAATYLLAMAATLYVFSRDSALSPWAALVPRTSDFGDYARVIRSILAHVPGLKKLARRTP